MYRDISEIPNCLFLFLFDKIKVNTAATYIGHHETAWTINKFSHIARKHELVEVCLNSLAKIYTLPNIEIQDAFIKLKEQVKCYFQPFQSLRTGLDIINSTNLDYFSPQQKAEFFELKGEFLNRMGMNEDAHSAFSTSISIYDNLSKGWLAWGLFCDQQFGEVRDITWAEYAINCYLQSIRCGSNRGRRMLARVLWLLNYEDTATTTTTSTNENNNNANPSGGDSYRLLKILDRYADSIPLWVWLRWIPQLLSFLSRSEATQIKNLLNKIAQSHPQVR